MEENVTQTTGGIMINVDVSVKKRHVCKKNYVWNLATCNWENGKYLANVMDDSAIICDRVIDGDAGAKSIDEVKSNDEETKSSFNKLY